MHHRRGVDAVPVAFAVVGARIVVPVDVVKAKRTTRLQRLINIEHDPRCVLLAEEYGEDWSRLWWVRVHATAAEAAPDGAALEALADRYPQYREPGSIVSCLVLTPTETASWSALP